jgi:hypothetical protein
MTNENTLEPGKTVHMRAGDRLTMYRPDQIAASPTMQALRRHAEQSETFAPRLDPNSPAVTPQAGRHVRELERLAKSKPTSWSPDFNSP